MDDSKELLRVHEAHRPSVAAVVAAFAEERWSDTLRAIRSVQEQSLPPDEIVLVIDHNEPLRDLARSVLTEVRVVENVGSRGASDARNTGVGVTSSDLVAFLDDDVTASPDWLEHSVPHFRDPRVVGVGGRVTPDWEKGPPRWFPEELLWAVGVSYRGLPEVTSEVRNVWTCNMVVRRSAFDKVDGFRGGFGKLGDREDFQAEDTEFCIRVARAWPFGSWIYEPKAVAFHKVPIRRSSWWFLVARCYHEGRNKVILSRVIGAERLTREKRHLMRTMPRGFARGLMDALRGDVSGLARSTTLAFGMAAALVGVLSGRTQATDQDDHVSPCATICARTNATASRWPP